MSSGKKIMDEVISVLERARDEGSMLREVIVQAYSEASWSDDRVSAYPVAIIRPPRIGAESPYTSNLEDTRTYTFLIHIVVKNELIDRDTYLVELADEISDQLSVEIDLDNTATAGCEVVSSSDPVEFSVGGTGYTIFEIQFSAKALIQIYE